VVSIIPDRQAKNKSIIKMLVYSVKYSNNLTTMIQRFNCYNQTTQKNKNQKLENKKNHSSEHFSSFFVKQEMRTFNVHQGCENLFHPFFNSFLS